MLKKFLIGTFVVFALAFAMSASAAYDFGPTTLKVGSTGQYVMNVQTVVGVNADGAFGPMTKAAVMAWQANHGLTADGVVGPATKNAMNAGSYTGNTNTTCPVGQFNPMTGLPCGTTTTYPAGCTSAVGYSTTTGAKCDGTTTTTTPGTVLGGDEGDMTNFDEVSSADSKLQEGAKSELFAFTADVEGDVKVDRVDFYLDSTAAGSQSDNADDYFQAAILMVDGKEVATLDVDNFDEDTYAEVDVVTGDTKEYRLRFSGLDLVFKDGDSPKFVLAFEANGAIDGTDLTEIWGVELLSTSVRFVDGKGFSDNTGAALEETFTPETQDVAKIAVNSSSNDPDLTTFEVSSTDETKDVVVFKFELEEKNDVDATVEDMTITLTTTGTTDESAVVSSADLYSGSTLLGSESVPSNGVVAFTDLGLDIAAGETEELTLKLSFADLLVQGTTVTAVVTSIDSATDENGNDEGDMTITGEGLSSEAHILRSTGISVEIISATTTINTQDGATNDIAEFTWVFDVTAFGDDDVYINSKAADIVLDAGKAAGDVDAIYIIDYSTGAELASQGGVITESDSDVTAVSGDASAYSGVYSGDTFFKINNGTTGTFTLTVTGTNQTQAKSVRAQLVNLEWTVDEVTSATAMDAETATINSYTSNLGVDAATPYKPIN